MEVSGAISAICFDVQEGKISRGSSKEITDNRPLLVAMPELASPNVKVRGVIRNGEFVAISSRIISPELYSIQTLLAF
jgi:hypothetical protein